MTQHEYVFVAISIILGLAITRLLNTVAMLTRVQHGIKFHWSTVIWSLSIMGYILQLWWVGWGLRELTVWEFSDFLTLVAGSICIYGAAEMALPMPGEEKLDMLQHSQGLGRLSALSMLLYFIIGPYVNLTLFNNPVLPSTILPAIGVLLMAIIIGRPLWFKWMSLLFAIYSVAIFYLTA